MYYTGIDPRDGKSVYVCRNPHEKAMQRALIQYRNPKNYDLVYEALTKAGRTDLIGYDKKCLIRPRKTEYNRNTVSEKRTERDRNTASEKRTAQGRNTASEKRTVHGRNTASEQRTAHGRNAVSGRKKTIRNVHAKKKG